LQGHVGIESYEGIESYHTIDDWVFTSPIKKNVSDRLGRFQNGSSLLERKELGVEIGVSHPPAVLNGFLQLNLVLNGFRPPAVGFRPRMEAFGVFRRTREFLKGNRAELRLARLCARV
jgi:hypothetical protein